MRTRSTQTRNSVQFGVARRGLPSAASFRRWSLGAPVTIRIVGASEGRRLNREYRGKNKPTNILSFHSGDIVLCHPVVAREAKQQKKPLAAHYAHLVVHGVLHLRGLRHGKRMEAREIRILRRFGFADPYTVE